VTELPNFSCQGLVVTASPATLRVTQLIPVAPATTQLTARFVPQGCYSGTVPALYSIDRYDLATVSASGLLTLVTPLAGPIQVTAYAGDFSARTTVQVEVDAEERAAAPPSAGSGFTPPPDPPSVCDYALYGGSRLVLGSNSTTRGPVGGAGSVELKQGAASDGIQAGGDVVLRKDAVINGSVVAGGSVSAAGASVIGNTQPTSTVSLPAVPSRALTCSGTVSRTVTSGTTVTLPPGNYANVEVKPGGRLVLQAGTYNIKSLVVGSNAGSAGANLQFPTTGNVNLDVCSALSLGNATQMSGIAQGADAGRLRWYYAGTTPISIKNGGTAYGIFSAPSAEVDLDSSATLRGLVYAKVVDVGPNATIDPSGLLGVGCLAAGLEPATPSPQPVDTAAVLYPYANTVMPLGLRAPLLQWATGTLGAAAAVRITLRFPATGPTAFRYSVVTAENKALFLDPPANTVPLAPGPRFPISQAAWEVFEQTARGKTAAIVLERMTGTTVRAPLTVPIKFANGQLKGTVYYQSYGTLLVQNYWGKKTYAPQAYGANQKFGAATLAIQPGADYPTVAAGFTSASNAVGCRVCHTASANGSVLVTSLGTDYGSSMLYRLGSDRPDAGSPFLPQPNYGTYEKGALSPDGSLLFSGHDGGQARLYSLRSSSLGQALSAQGIPAGLKAAMPVFSPDGTKVAFNHYEGTVNGVSADKRSLAVMDANLTTRSFSNFRIAFDEPQATCDASFHPSNPCTSVWPSFLPKSEALVFEREVYFNGRDFGGTRSHCDATGTCGDDGAKGELWWVGTGANAPAARLNAANGRSSSGAAVIPTGSNGHTATVEPVLNYEPSVNPVEAGGYYWVAFTSRRLYGNVATVNPWWSDPRWKPIGGQYGPTTKKIWVAAIDPSAPPGSDPSAPAFYLPGQELLAGNAKAYWVNEACRQPSSVRSAANECQTNLDCCGAPTSSICALDTPISNPPARHCVPITTSACIADASPATCTSDGQCCGFSSGSRCANGVCQLPPPVELYLPGELSRDYRGTCSSWTTRVWRTLEWLADIPSGTSIEFWVATAKSEAELSAAEPVRLAVATASSPSAWTASQATVAQALLRADQTPYEYLRVTAKLNPDASRRLAPTLMDLRQIFDCIDSQ
jgi:hypothetical protein